MTHMIRTSLIASALALAALALPSTAYAQFATNSNAPIDGSADKAEYFGDVTILSGQVDVRQADTRILSDRMKIYSAKTGTGQGGAFDNVDRIEADGNFFYITPDQEVRGEAGLYEAAKDTFTVTGNVILLQGEDNIVTGDKLIYNLTSNEARVVGTCQGRKCGANGRVKILIKNTKAATSRTSS